MLIYLNDIVKKVLSIHFVKKQLVVDEINMNKYIMDVIVTKLKAEKHNSCLILFNLFEVIKDYDEIVEFELPYENHFIKPSLHFNKIAKIINANIFKKYGIVNGIKYMNKKTKQSIRARLGIQKKNIIQEDGYFNATEFCRKEEKEYETWRANNLNLIGNQEYHKEGCFYLEAIYLPYLAIWVSVECAKTFSMTLKKYFIAVGKNINNAKFKNMKKKLSDIKKIIKN